MMKLRPLVTAGLLAGAAVRGSAADSGLYTDYESRDPRWRIALASGYAFTRLGDVASRYRKAYGDLAAGYSDAVGGKASAVVKGGSGGPLATADIGYALTPERGAGVRLGWTSPARIAADFAVTGPLRQAESQYLTTSLWTVLVGGWEERANADGAYVRGSLYAGLGIADLTDVFRFSSKFYAAPEQSDSATTDWRGITAIAAQVGVEGGFPLAPGWTLFTGAGYHLARIRTMTATRDAKTDTGHQPFVSRGTTLSDLDGSAVPFDFSGLHLTAGLRVAL